MLFDTHAHLNAPAFAGDLDQVLARALSKSVLQMLVVGYNLASSHKAVALARRYPERLFAAVGIHPHDAEQADTASVAAIRALATEPGVVAIGETGLDYYRDLAPRARQQEAFAAMLDLAEGIGLPVIIHSREALADVLTAVEERQLSTGGVLHAFAGESSDVDRAVGAGLMLSFAGPLTYPRAATLREAAFRVPAEHLLVETDCPYLPPQPWRGKRNEPAYLPATVEMLANVRGMTTEACASLGTANAHRLFGIASRTRTAA
ncbi:MAG: hydrolase TatD [Dehalococcoidia bacterium]|nr:hydrolase TatD [Dehalococcoidia bacterium]